MTDLPQPESDEDPYESRWMLNVNAGAFGVKVPAEQQFSGEAPPDNRKAGSLPIWIDREGNLRIALRNHQPQWFSDYDQIIVDLGALLRGIGIAVEQRPRR